MRATWKLTLHKVLLVTSTLYLYLNTVHAGLFCPSYVGNYDYHFVLEIYDVPPECLENNNIIYSLDSAGVIKCSNNTECKTSTDVADSYEVWFKKLGRPNGLQYNLTYPSTANVTLPLGTYQTVWTCGRHQYNHSCTVRTGVEEDECDFCLHNTYCEDLPVGYQCLCEDGYSGINCSQGDQRLYCNYTDIVYSTYAHACSDPKALDCYVAGLTLSQPLQFNLHEVQFNVSFLMTNQSANISICVPESAVIGNYTFIGTIEAETREKFDLTFDVYLMSVFLNVPEYGYYLFNVSEDVSVNDKVVNVSKTPCSDCIQIVDNKKTENIHFFDTVWDDAITLDKNTFIVTRPLKAPNVVMKKLKAAVGQLDYGSINVTFQVTDVDEPPSCNETEIDIEISLPGDSVDTLDVHLNCSDPDVEAKFKVINYSVDPNYESFFSVNEDGILRVTSSLAYLAPGLHHFNITLNKDYKDDRFRIILQISLTIIDPTQESGDTTVPTEQDDTTETTEPMSTTTTVSDTLRNTTLFYYPTPSASRYITTATSANSTSFVTSNLFSTASTPSTPTFGSLSTVTSIGHNSTFASSGYLSTITSSRYVSTLTSSDYVGTLESTDYVATLASSFYVSALTSSNPLTSSDPVTKLTSSGYVSTLTSSGYISTLTSSDYVSTPDSTNHASVTNTNTVLNTSVTTSGTTPTVSLGFTSQSEMITFPVSLSTAADSLSTHSPVDPFYITTKSEDSIMTNTLSNPVYTSKASEDSITTNSPSDIVYSSDSIMTNAPTDLVYLSDSIMTNAPTDPVYLSDSIMTNAPSDPVYSSNSKMTNAPSDPVYSSDSIMTNAPSDPVYSSTKLADSIRKTSSTISLSTLVASEAFSSLSSTNILSHTLTITFSSTSKSIDMLSTSATSFQLTTANFLSTTESTYFFSWSTQSTPTLTPEVSQISESPLITPTATVSLNSVYTKSSDSQMPSTLVVDPTSTPVVTSTLPPENCIPETVVLTQTLAQKNKTIYNISCSQSGVVGLELLSSGEAGDAVQLIGTSIFLSKELPNTLANFTIIVAVKFVGRSDNYSTTFLLACPETREPDGVIFSQAWPETLHTEACPTGYSGTISRWCTKDATWEPYNITSCTRGVDKALNMLDQLNSSSLNMSLVKEIIKLADPQKPVNNSEDFKNLLTILNRLSITFKDSDAPLDFDSFQQIANITDQLVSGDDNVWLNERSGQDQAAQLMESFERMATASLKSLNKTGEITLTTSKLGITLNVLAKNITYDSTQSQGWVNEAKNKISYDPLDAGSLNYSIILYRNLADHVRLNQSLQEKFEESKGLVNKTFNSYIISISVSQGQISKPISITFSLVQNNYSKPACGFLNTSNSLESFWSTSGCTVTAFSESQVTCTCNHLTNFAVLMSPFGNLIDTEALSYISIIGCSISLFCLTLTVIIYIVLWKYLKNDRSVLHLNLSVCLMIGYIVFLAGVRSTENRVGCIVVAALLHYFFLAVFFMMLAEGVEIIKSVSFVFTSRSIIGYLLLGAYGIPLIIVGVSLAVTQTEGYGNDKYCWLSTSSGLIWAFVGPVLLIFLANLIILIIVLRTMQTSRIIKDKSVPDRVKSAIRSICILSPILGLAWIFGVLSVNEASQVFTYLFAIFNSLQGLFIFIFQCLLQHQVKDAMKEKRRKYKVQNSVDSGQKLVSSNSSVRGTQSQSNTTTKSTSEGVFDYPLFPNAVYKDAKNESNTVYKDAKNGNKNEVTRGLDATEAANMAIKEDNYMNYDLAYAGTPYKNSDPMVFPNYGFSFSEMDLDDFKSNNQIVEIDGNSIRSKESWQARSRRRKQGLDENAEIEKERLKHVYGDVQAVRRLPQNSVPENSQLRAKERWKQLQLLAKSTQKSKDRDSIPETKEDIFMAPQLGALVDSYKHNNPKKSRPQLPPLVIPRPNAGHSLSPGYHSHI